MGFPICQRRFVVVCAGLVILAFWLAMMGLLARRVSSGSVLPLSPVGVRLGASEDPTSPGGSGKTHRQGIEEEWLGIYFQNERIGRSWTLTRKLPAGYRVENRTTMQLTMMGTVQDVSSSLVYETTETYALRSFDFSLNSREHLLRAKGEVRKGSLELEVESGGKKSTQRIALGREVFLPEGLEPLIVQGRLKEGKQYQFSVFDPTTLSPGKLTVTYLGREKIRSNDAVANALKFAVDFQGMRSTAYVDEQGHTLREETPMGLISVRESQEQWLSWQPTSSRLSLDLLTYLSVPTEGEIPSPRQTRYLKLELEGAPPEAIPQDECQRVFRQGDRIIVEASAPAFGAQAESPQGPERPVREEAGMRDLSAYLKPTPLIQSNDPEIVRQARSITAGTEDKGKAATLLLEWVYDHIAKRPTVSIPSAVDVLRTREGDCNEHAVLYAALARAVGIPARILTGIVYAENPKPRFYYHAWNSVYVPPGSGAFSNRDTNGLCEPRGNWVAVDPAFGQPLADAAHIFLAEGEMENQLQLLPLMGKLKVRVLEARN